MLQLIKNKNNLLRVSFKRHTKFKLALIKNGYKDWDTSLFVLMKEHGAGKHYLNWAISRDDYVCGFANCMAPLHRYGETCPVVEQKIQVHDCSLRKARKFPREMSSLIKRYGACTVIAG